jgi:hypothetical protein
MVEEAHNYPRRLSDRSPAEGQTVDGRVGVRRRLAQVTLVFALVAGSTFAATAAPAAAHCPGTGPSSQYVAGGNSTWVTAVRTKIGWVQGDVCTSGVSHSISVVYNSNDGWLQAGWRYYDGYSEPMGYCERKPTAATGNSYALTEYAIAHQGQWYTYKLNSSNQWECKIAGVVKRVTASSWIGFSSGNWVPVQAEAHEDHLQLGRVAPNWLSFYRAGYTPVLTTGWTDMPINGIHSDDPVWNYDNPLTNKMRVNTDASH